MERDRIQGGLREDEQDVFYEIAHCFGDVSSEGERAALEAVQERHRQKWCENGVMRNLIDSVPDLSGNTSIALARAFCDGEDIGYMQEKVYFKVRSQYEKNGSTFYRKQKLTAFVIDEREALLPFGRFTFDQAVDLLEQVDELYKLKELGLLPNLNDSLSALYVTSSGVS